MNRLPTYCRPQIRSFILFALCLLIPCAAMGAPVKHRKFVFTYSLELPKIEKKLGPIHIFVPIASSDNYQKIEKLKVESGEPKGQIKTESTYGNQYWHLKLDEIKAEKYKVQINYLITRKPYENTPDNKYTVKNLTPQQIMEYQNFLKPNDRVPTSGKLIDGIRKNIRGETLLQKSRSIYEYVIDNMEYKKIGTGWGNGDTYWACSKKYGNCTDFHALFISLARAEGIPSRFEIGFPIPMDRKNGEIKGYHCWVNFFLPRVGWVPIDASEAKKAPKKKAFYFGNFPPDRIKFSVGRDLKLGNGHQSPPLNYFVYPHIEVGGKPWKKFKTAFHFQEFTRILQ